MWCGRAAACWTEPGSSYSANRLEPGTTDVLARTPVQASVSVPQQPHCPDAVAPRNTDETCAWVLQIGVLDTVLPDHQEKLEAVSVIRLKRLGQVSIQVSSLTRCRASHLTAVLLHGLSSLRPSNQRPIMLSACCGDIRISCLESHRMWTKPCVNPIFRLPRRRCTSCGWTRGGSRPSCRPSGYGREMRPQPWRCRPGAHFSRHFAKPRQLLGLHASRTAGVTEHNPHHGTIDAARPSHSAVQTGRQLGASDCRSSRLRRKKRFAALQGELKPERLDGFLQDLMSGRQRTTPIQVSQKLRHHCEC